MVSARRPRTWVGACRYKTSASDAEMRPPSLTFATIESTINISAEAEASALAVSSAGRRRRIEHASLRARSEKLQPSPAGAEAHVGSEIEKHLQTRGFLGAQAVFHIIP